MTEENKSTLVVMPFVSKQGFSAATTMSLFFSITEGGFRGCRFLFLGDHTTVGARNMGCREAIKLGVDYVLFLDSDMDWPVDTLDRLKDCESDIACIEMWSRNIPSFCTVMRLGGVNDEGKEFFVPHVGKGIEDVDMCGMACTLIRTDLLKRMKDPWFWSTIHGEDATFCISAKKEYGATIRCNYEAKAGHWGTVRMVGQNWTRNTDNMVGEFSEPGMMKKMKIFQGQHEALIT